MKERKKNKKKKTKKIVYKSQKARGVELIRENQSLDLKLEELEQKRRSI